MENSTSLHVPIPPPPDTVPGPGLPLPDRQRPADPPGYELLYRLGRGGMSVVYAARQLTLNRTVAVKFLRPDADGSAELLARFRAEAEAVARLSHPNVVQVYEVGERDGHPYLVLELVAGGTLAERLRDGPLAAADAASLVRTLARAVAVAHDAGIVHRDLKPANILLQGSRSEDRGARTEVPALDPRTSLLDPIPKIADFGLAKRLDVAEGMTATGAVLGTPSYMAPEQASGAGEIGTACDVYSLGAVLYECLTGRPPFRAAGLAETLDLVRHADPVPPRALQPGVPRDIETVCLKCLRKPTADRYESATALADDLNRFLAGQSILARPVGPATRAAKWCRRHPAPAGLIALAVLVPVGLALGVVEHNARLQTALDAKTAEEAKARQEKERADENYRQARDVLRKMLDKASDKRFADVPRAKELYAAQAAAALDYFRNVAAQRDDPDPQVRFDAAAAELEAHDMYSALGNNAPLEGCGRRAKAGFESVLAVTERRDARLRKAEATGRIGLSLLGKPESLAYTEEAVQDLTALVADPGATRLERTQLGGMENNLGRAHHSLGDFENAAKWFRAAYDRRAQLMAEDPADHITARWLAENALNLVNVYQLTQRPADAAAMNEVATTTLERLLAADRTDRSIARALALNRVNYSYTQRADGRLAVAIAGLTKSVADLEPFYRTDPTDNAVRDALFKVHGVRGECHGIAGQSAAAARDAEQVVFYSATPGQKRYQRWFVARSKMRAGEFPGAVADLEENLRLFPANGNSAEPFHGAETAALMATRARAAAVVAGGGADAEAYLRLARRLLEKAESAAGLLGRVTYLKDFAASPHLAIMREK